MIDLTTLSTTELDTLAERASARAKALRAKAPSISLALQAGVRDTSYSTPRWGYIESYSGTAVITMADGSQWEATGYGPSGNAHVVTRDGGITFRQITPSTTTEVA